MRSDPQQQTSNTVLFEFRCSPLCHGLKNGAVRRTNTHASADAPRCFGRSSHSNSPMPANMAMTNTAPLKMPEPKSTRAGPGQIPANPQPTPNSRLPTIRRRSMCRAVGRFIGKPRSDRVRLRAPPKPTIATAIAPTMTNAREGSHIPATSRNPSTLAGFVIPDTSKPTPNMSPANQAKKSAKVNFLPRGGGS
ncbi:hypothetical protein PHLH4_30710 [Pseudomonas sp. St316]|nr:hypothetical protein PHLH4_30710 [Pseudomonas sp. St316]